MVAVIEEHGVEDTLDAVESIWLESLRRQCELFELASHYADLCNGDGVVRPGCG